MALFPDYRAHIIHCAAAKSHSEVWRLVVGLCVMVGAYFVMTLAYQLVLNEYVTKYPKFQTELMSGSTPLAMYALLMGFALITLAVFFGVKMVHHRDPQTVFGPKILAVPQFFRVLGMLVALGAVLMVLPPYGMDEPLVPNLPVGRWLLLLPLSLIAVFVQISAEEVFFRGYLQQQLGARFKSPLIWMVLPSALFALGHYQPNEAGDNAVLILLWAGVFGLLMADLTARSGTIGPALAVHFVNNISALLIAALPDSLGGLALWHAPFGMNDAAQLRDWLPVDFALMLVSWLAARLALRR
ncbi:CPBP family intramembrane glutamic endopeptidase [Sulfitobacter donghicola]|uniref:CAAX amino terminal protease n=1 Tax=Sulfitobacter donghicola DSW-25 = KCTC 12864 = JCM 14565 TaxID=1300350 RepID=A0A073ILM8_9RHOB|nr:type II CAAX endopeptidase family protein [Sulfitobacter donghicola]KEJ90475.1 CAAX amino terminal protease [Sulfitobacter donghicola DSW-25 = KCTC 12864 = JCM 14565]KIN67714.1 Caax amino terminal protease family protein [Sulfitobacter donghicola DSW-25 = KCTC 12864 = JCM 14565]